jgi:hypothetical protein
MEVGQGKFIAHLRAVIVELLILHADNGRRGACSSRAMTGRKRSASGSGKQEFGLRLRAIVENPRAL